MDDSKVILDKIVELLGDKLIVSKADDKDHNTRSKLYEKWLKKDCKYKCTLCPTCQKQFKDIISI